MALLLLVAFIAIPLIEIAVFIQVGGLLGLWTTLALVILTAMLGTWQLRAQGLATLNRARSHMDQGVLPANELFDGLCLLVAGALLLTPGFVTDAAGFLLFLSPVRDALRHWLGRRMQDRGQARMWVNGEEIPPGAGPGPRPGPGPGPRTGPQPGTPQRGRPGGGPSGGSGGGPRGGPRRDTTVIDGDYRDVTPGDDAGATGPDDSKPKGPAR